MLRPPMAPYLLLLLLSLLHQNPGPCDSLGAEGSALLRFRERAEADPCGALSDWGEGTPESDPCSRFGVECSDLGRLSSLNLKDLCLEGTLTPELGKLIHMKSLNDKKASNRRLLQVVSNEKGRHRKHGKNLTRGRAPTPSPSPSPSPSTFGFLFRPMPLFSPKFPSPVVVPSPAKNEPPSPAPPKHQPRPDATQPSTSVLAPSVSESPSPLPASQHTASWATYMSIGGGVSFLIAFAAIYTFCCRADKVITVMPWSTGLSGQLQKALVTGVPSLKRSELERACEDFSNIIEDTLSDCMLYKGTLSTGVEIAVTSSMITAAKDWSEQSEAQFRKKISMLSKVNHKNFMNLIGYCEEEEPFTRMMVFEYTPNGTLFEHLHIKEAEHLDWPARLRIAMGIAYCLQHMHQLDPPALLKDLHSSSVYLTDDYAAKISDLGFCSDVTEPEPEPASETPGLSSGPESIVYKFGIILLEMISGRRPFSKDDGLLVLWASCYLTGQRPLVDMVDSTLESFREEDVAALCEVIRPCIHPDPRERPTMAEVVARLRQITAMPPDGATPKISPLWWAELEIISSDAFAG